MKLYGKIESERASKGQGGKELKFSVQNEDRKPLIYLTVKVLDDGQPIIRLWTADSSWSRSEYYQDNEPFSLILMPLKYKETIEHKANKQKGDKAINDFLEKSDIPQ